MSYTKYALLSVGILVVGVLVFVTAENRKSVREEAPTIATEKADYHVVFLGGTPMQRLAFEGFREKFDELAKEGDVSIEYMTLDVPVSPINMRNAVDHIVLYNASLVVTGQAEVRYLVEKITTTPIISLFAADPVATGLAVNEKGSGNNVVFLDSGTHDSAGRRLEFFLEAMPQAKNILVPRGAASVPTESDAGMLELAQAVKGHDVTIIEKRFASREELNKFLLDYDFSQVDAVFRYPGTFIAANFDLFYALKEKIKKPFIVINKEELAMGGLIAYGPRYEEFGRSGAVIAWQILKGQIAPADVPIIRPFRYMLGVNQLVAATFGIAIPDALLQKADYIIE
ncbi:MAG: ABC transporter substrate binding protein [bacterium]|nr:ABC transporter substrate binding protein [bacterium]